MFAFNKSSSMQQLQDVKYLKLSVHIILISNKKQTGSNIRYLRINGILQLVCELIHPLNA